MRLGVVFGGQSYEHEVSIISAIALSKVFKSEDIAYIFCDKDRKFYLIDPKNMVASILKTVRIKPAELVLASQKICIFQTAVFI